MKFVCGVLQLNISSFFLIYIYIYWRQLYFSSLCECQWSYIYCRLPRSLSLRPAVLLTPTYLCSVPVPVQASSGPSLWTGDDILSGSFCHSPNVTLGVGRGEVVGDLSNSTCWNRQSPWRTVTPVVLTTNPGSLHRPHRLSLSDCYCSSWLFRIHDNEGQIKRDR